MLKVRFNLTDEETAYREAIASGQDPYPGYELNVQSRVFVYSRTVNPMDDTIISSATYSFPISGDGGYTAQVKFTCEIGSAKPLLLFRY